MNDRVVRVGDRVTIVEPEIFARCGYPIDQRELAESIQSNFSLRICELIDEIDPNGSKGCYGKGFDFEALCGRLARIVAVRHDFGGNERKIYTRQDNTLRGVQCRVIGKRVCKTGTRYGQYVGYSWDGEWDYEPGGLDNQKTHVILKIAPTYDPERIWDYDLGVFEIERRHVRKCDARSS